MVFLIGITVGVHTAAHIGLVVQVTSLKGAILTINVWQGSCVAGLPGL